MRRLAFAICQSNDNPLSCTTGHIILKTYRTLDAARTGLARMKNKKGCWVGQRESGRYVRVETSTEE